MFRGVQNINMDAKGRVAMPAKYRDALNSEGSSPLIATIDPQHQCLLIYPLHTWEGIEQELLRLPATQKVARRYARLVLGHASELELDANGRVRIPQMLQSYAALEKKLVLAGLGNKFELWSEENWQQELTGGVDQFADMDLGGEEAPDSLKNLAL